MLSALSKALFVSQIATVCLAGGAHATAQSAFHAPSDEERSEFINFPVAPGGDSEFYEFRWPIRRVAIIGAGVSGLLAYRELHAAGFDHIRVFERDAVPGGNWHYTEETPVAVAVPNDDPKIADYVPELPPLGSAMPLEIWHADHNDTISTAERWRRHRAPHAVWKSLTSNVPAPLMHFNGYDWPPGTPWHLTQTLLTRYLRSFASFLGMNSNDENPDMSYSTRVELVRKRVDADGTERGWQLTLKKLVRLGPATSMERWWTEDFDAVVIATGTFNAPNIPAIPGLPEWARRFPGSVLHSREYRYPERFANESIIVVGAGPSAVGISADLNPVAQRTTSLLGGVALIHNLTDSTTPPDFLNLLPQGVQIVGGIKRVHASNGTIELSDGTLLIGIDRIIFSTGYRYTFPFLPQYHDSTLGRDGEPPAGAPQPLVTDGSHLRALYLDFLHIEEPTLGFMNMNYGTITFTYGEYLAVALARVWAGTARLPSTTAMWARYRADVARRGGYGRGLAFLGTGLMTRNTNLFLAWLNGAALEFGGTPMHPPTKDFYEIMSIWLKAFFANPDPVRPPSVAGVAANAGSGSSPEVAFAYLTGGY
ncbi:FAD/NAD(P)-binding domain-containing protein [Mycena sp. CBHHK59/15]|nr:FAD/NAD(P)-binding domain-containing protein [Mycena sp. CBHHK59/15]